MEDFVAPINIERATVYPWPFIGGYAASAITP